MWILDFRQHNTHLSNLYRCSGATVVKSCCWGLRQELCIKNSGTDCSQTARKKRITREEDNREGIYSQEGENLLPLKSLSTEIAQCRMLPKCLNVWTLKPVRL